MVTGGRLALYGREGGKTRFLDTAALDKLRDLDVDHDAALRAERGAVLIPRGGRSEGGEEPT